MASLENILAELVNGLANCQASEYCCSVVWSVCIKEEKSQVGAELSSSRCDCRCLGDGRSGEKSCLMMILFSSRNQYRLSDPLAQACKGEMNRGVSSLV